MRGARFPPEERDWWAAAPPPRLAQSFPSFFSLLGRQLRWKDRSTALSGIRPKQAGDRPSFGPLAPALYGLWQLRNACVRRVACTRSSADRREALFHSELARYRNPGCSPPCGRRNIRCLTSDNRPKKQRRQAKLPDNLIDAKKPPSAGLSKP